ncbi:Hypothetical protein FKW44_015851 [Caligus rogercresseyi]|uniref:Uncharacterized protein n=1 Tax=Caligus rogercresseyi TaxID=217165 RepID=A0A7T8H1N3_CALRO|nr:Hypothetical protein FKW44_015851 [Caligus rogercresseyi]
MVRGGQQKSGLQTDEKQEPEVKKSMLHECVDMDIDTDDPEGGRDDAASKEEEKARSMPWDSHALSSNTGGIPGLGDGKDSEKKATEQKLVDLSSKDLENISKAVLSLTSKKSEESPPIADDVPTSKEPILPPNEEHPPDNAGWGNKPWRPESSANQGDTLRASLFSRRNNMDSDERGIIAPWGHPRPDLPRR